MLGVYDKGKGTVVKTETVLAEKGGEIYTRAIGNGYFVGQGNWGGPKGTPLHCSGASVASIDPDIGPPTEDFPPLIRKEPDIVHTVQTTKELAHLYRYGGELTFPVL